MRATNGDYYIRREAEEWAAAQQASCPEAAAAHRELAKRYAILVEVETKLLSI